MTESLGEGCPHDGITGEQQTSRQQAQGDMQLQSHSKCEKFHLFSHCEKYSFDFLLSQHKHHSSDAVFFPLCAHP